MIEKRKNMRNRTYLGGCIQFNHDLSTMDCLIRNLSNEGAKLIYTNSVTVPGEFDLQITAKGYSRRARVVWRRKDEAGVEFIDNTANIIPINTDLARRLRASEARNATLKNRIEELQS